MLQVLLRFSKKCCFDVCGGFLMKRSKLFIYERDICIFLIQAGRLAEYGQWCIEILNKRESGESCNGPK